MKFESAFNCGDKGWVYTDRPEQLTIGQINIRFTNSKGVRGGRVDPNIPVAFDNYKAQSGYEEVYMCVETGIESGSLYTYGESIFKTEQECIAANAERIEEQRKADEAHREWERGDALRRLEQARRDLALLESKDANSAAGN